MEFSFEEHLDIIVPEKTFFDYIKPFKNEDHKKTCIYLYGFPNDEGKYNIGERVGCEKGPFSFRKGLKDYSFIVFEKINAISIYDDGNAPHDILNDNNLCESHKVLQLKIKECLLRKNAVSFVIGGSNDLTYSTFKGFSLTFPLKSIGIININAHLDVRQIKPDKFHSNSTFRMIMDDEYFTNSNSLVYNFATQSVQNTFADSQYVLEKNGKIIWLNKNIRRFKINENHPTLSTQAGQLFESTLFEISQKVEIILISFDLDSINSMFCPGVSSPSVIGGLTDNEASEILWLAGKNKKVRMMDMVEFNPAVEDARTRKLVSYLFFKFCEGVSEQ